MKEILKEYYKINICEYKEYNDGIIFFIHDSYYYLCKCQYDEEYLKYIFNIINKLKVKLHSFVFNKDNNLLSDKYILLKLNYIISDININDIYKFNIKVDSSNYVDIVTYYRNKIDRLESEVFESKEKILIYSYDYYSGIVEMLLSYFNNNIYNGNLYLCHKKMSLSTIDFYNPLNITYDLYLRDIASYIILNNGYELLYNYLIKLNDYEKFYLYCRLIIPFKYFELVEEILKGENRIKELEEYIKLRKVFEEHIARIEKIFNYNIFKWIKKE